MAKQGIPGARAATAGAQAIHEATPLPMPPSWAGYWTFVSAAIIVMFVLYLAQKGTLSTWLGFFAWTSPQNVGTTAAPVGSSSTANPGLLGGSNPTGALTLNPATGFGLFPELNATIGNITGMFGGGSSSGSGSK